MTCSFLYILTGHLLRMGSIHRQCLFPGVYMSWRAFEFYENVVNNSLNLGYSASEWVLGKSSVTKINEIKWWD